MKRDRDDEMTPQSQRTTIPTPMPFAAVAAASGGDRGRVKPSVGHYLIVNEGAVERLRLR